MLEPLQPGDPESIGNYTLDGRLGMGGFAIVYLGHTTSGYRAAIKVIRPEFAQDSKLLERFFKEANQANRIKPIFTAPVIEWKAERKPWIATSFVNGPDLATYAGHTGLPANHVAKLGAMLTEVLEDIHGKGIVHRDIKPPNVLITPEGPRVIDFGVVRVLDQSSQAMSGTFNLVGTPPYMSPEQVRADSKLDHRSDIFALGSLLSFAATGVTLWADDSTQDSTQKVLDRVENEDADLSGIDDPRLRTVIQACLQKDPADRLRLDEIRNLLARLVTGPLPRPEPPLPEPPLPGPSSPPPGDGEAPTPSPRPTAPVAPAGPERIALTTPAMRASRVATYLGRIALFPLAVLAGASAFQLFAYPQDDVATPVALLLAPAALVVLLALTGRARPRVHDHVDVSEDGIDVVDSRVMRLNQVKRYAGWFRITEVRTVVEDDLWAVVVTFPPASTAPVDVFGPQHESYRHHLGYVLTWIRADTPRQTAAARKLTKAVERAWRAYLARAGTGSQSLTESDSDNHSADLVTPTWRRS